MEFLKKAKKQLEGYQFSPLNMKKLIIIIILINIYQNTNVIDIINYDTKRTDVTKTVRKVTGENLF